MKKILNEFKKFISKGNALDLAVGVVVGGAFSKIVSSLVNDVIMPLIGVIIGGIDFTNLSLKVGEATVNYGTFIQNIIDFLIISFCIFLVVKTLNTLNDMTKKKLVKEEKIRDAVTFQEEASDANNHFVKLIINGEKRESNGLGSGANPRTAIGQKADGTVLLLVTDGRGASGHLGATASDLIEVMEKYGAVNAANLDGGSSSTMYYKDKYLMTSVTLYYSNSSWRLPEAFIIEK